MPLLCSLLLALISAMMPVTRRTLSTITLIVLPALFANSWKQELLVLLCHK